MGNSDPPIKKILATINQIKKTIPSGRFFEFGDDPEILVSIEKQLKQVHHSLGALKDHYSSLPMKESNLYYQAMKVAHDTQQFMERIQNREANLGNTQELHDHIDKLENAVRLLWTGDETVDGPDDTPNNKDKLPKKVNKSPDFQNSKPTAKKITHSQSAEKNKAKRLNFSNAFKAIVVIPKPVGRFIFDLFGRHDSADSSSTIMGWLLVFIVTLILLGLVPLNALILKLSEWWRFFFPVK